MTLVLWWMWCQKRYKPFRAPYRDFLENGTTSTTSTTDSNFLR
jgi:hypothetical protein